MSYDLDKAWEDLTQEVEQRLMDSYTSAIISILYEGQLVKIAIKFPRDDFPSDMLEYWAEEDNHRHILEIAGEQFLRSPSSQILEVIKIDDVVSLSLDHPPLHVKNS
jgi:hypothetical protein